MSMLFSEEDQNGFGAASNHVESDDDQSSVGSQDFAENQGFHTLTIGNERFSDRDHMDEYLSPVVPTMRDPAAHKFDEFIRSTKALEGLFKKCGYTVQRLGSALELSRTSLEFYKSLRRVRIHFQENSETLTGIPHARERPISLDQLARYRGSMPSMSNGSTAIFEEDINLLDYLEKLHDVLGKFVIAIVEFNDYYADEEGGDALHNFRREIRLLHESLHYFGADGSGENTKELQRYVLSRAISLREHIDEMSVAMKRFIENGIPCIAFAQKRFAKVLSNASSVAVFFSGVAATTLQYSFNNPRTSIDNATNTLWFAALVLSIGSAVSGLLTMTWRQAIYSSPSRSLPPPLRFWMRHGYLLLLVAAVVAYCSGLITYVFAQQSRATAWIILALIILCDLGVIALTTWYGWEKWNFISLQNQKYLSMQWAKIWVKKTLADVHRKGASAIRKDRSSAPYSTKGEGTSKIPTCDDNTKARLRVRLPRHGARHGSHFDDYRPASWHDTLVTNATSVKEQVAAITSLTPLDVEEKEVKHMQFSPCGRWFVACFKKTSRIYNVERNIRPHQEMIHRGGNAKQVEWAAKGNRFLTRFKHGVNLWELKDNSFILGMTFKIPDLCLIQWLNDKFLALTDFGDSLWRVNVAEDKKKFYSLPRDLQIQDMCAVTGTEYDRVIFVASRPLGLPGDTPKGIDCIIVFSLDDRIAEERTPPHVQSKKSGVHRRIEKRIPLTDRVMKLTVCRDRHHMLVSYETKPPEEWILGEELRMLSMRQVLPMPAPESKDEPVRKHVQWGEPFFLGEAQNIMACAANGEMNFWRLDENQHFLPFHRLLLAGVGEQIGGQPMYCFNNALPRGAVMATATAAGALKIWRSNSVTASPSVLTANHETPSSPSSLGAIPERVVR